MQPYLQVFQSDAPLLPFETSDLQGLLETLMSQFVKQGELGESWNCIQACEAGCYSAISSSSTMRCRCWICSKGITWKITEREEDQWSASIWVQERLHCNAGPNCSKDTGKISTQVQLGKEASVPRSLEDGVYTRRGCEDVSSCATKADSFRVENIKPGWLHSVSVQEVCVWCKEGTTRSSSYSTSTTTQD